MSLSRLDLRHLGAAAVDDPQIRDLATRGAVPDRAIRDAARDILDQVERGGSASLIELNRRFGGGPGPGGRRESATSPGVNGGRATADGRQAGGGRATADGRQAGRGGPGPGGRRESADRRDVADDVERLVIRGDDLARAAADLEPSVRDALETAIANVRRFAATQRPIDTTTTIVPGVEIERRWVPIARVGAYVPGGSAAYPSSLIMTVVPAQVAAVESIVVATPATHDGTVDPVLLGAAGILGVDAIIVAGGAQAIGALAFGLADLGVEPVDLIVGPGNAWVTAAKLELAGRTAIDLPAGPSEGMVIATPPADPDRVAADLLTQAEHGPDSPALLITTNVAFADAVAQAVARRVAVAARSDVLREALGRHGRIILVADVPTAVAIANAYAPEHLSIDVPDPEAAVALIRNAGSVFVGPWAPESAGDYATGANHVLPTGGLARACGPLAVETYGKFIQIQRISRDGLVTLRPTIGTLATAEGLFAHRDAVEIRFGAGIAGAALGNEAATPGSGSWPTRGDAAAGARGR